MKSLRFLLGSVITLLSIPNVHASIQLEVQGDELRVTTSNEVAVDIRCETGQVKVNQFVAAINCSELRSLKYLGSNVNEQITLNGFSENAFSSMVAAEVDPGFGTDSIEIIGSDAPETMEILPAFSSTRKIEITNQLSDRLLVVTTQRVMDVILDGRGGDDFLSGQQNGFTNLSSLTLLGGDGNDVLNGYSGQDVIKGGAGNDTIRGAASGIAGGVGLDILEGGSGDDAFFWQHNRKAGEINLLDGNVQITGGDGTDSLHVFGSDQAESFETRSGAVSSGFNLARRHDTTNRALEADQLEAVFIHAGVGNDIIDTGATPSLIALTVTGDAGDDRIIAGQGASTISGNDGSDRIELGLSDFASVAECGVGDDKLTVEGRDANDDLTLRGIPAALDLAGSSRAAISDCERLEINLGDGDDRLTSKDVATGFAGFRVTGGAGDDTIAGTPGDDELLGQLGADRLTGGAGNDHLVGGGGADSAEGQDGNDLFEWSPGDGHDRIEDSLGEDQLLVNHEASSSPISLHAIRDATGASRLESFEADIGSVVFAALEQVVIRGGAGADVLDAQDAVTSDAQQFFIFGGGGNDIIIGSSADDILNGGEGDDLLRGGGTLSSAGDHVAGGEGDDALEWKPADGFVNYDGSSGRDAVDVRLSEGPNLVTVARIGDSGQGVEVATSSGEHISLLAEALRIHGSPQTDHIDAQLLPADLLDFEAFGNAGDDVIDGSQGSDLIDGGEGNDVLVGRKNGSVRDEIVGGPGDDRMLWFPGDGSDVNVGGEGADATEIQGAAASEQFAISGAADSVVVDCLLPSAFQVESRSTEEVHVFGNAGDDQIDARSLSGATTLLHLVGGSGADVIHGSANVDEIEGGESNDIIVGGPNPAATSDRVDSGAGDDLIVWNPGDGSDVNNGGTGRDVVQVNGATASEHFSIGSNGDQIIVQRLLPTGFVLTNTAVEALALEAGNGNDLVETEMIPAFEQMLGGGGSTGVPHDVLKVVGYRGDALVSPILDASSARIEHAGFESIETEAPGPTFSAKLEGSQVVPAVLTDGHGMGYARLNADQNEIIFNLTYDGLSGPATRITVHGAAPVGVNAPALAELHSDGADGAVREFRMDVTPQDVASIAGGLWYFVVATQAHPDGEIRGQIAPNIVLEGVLEGRQVVPKTTSPARGYATATVLGASGEMTLTVSYQGLADIGVGATASLLKGPAPRGRNANTLPFGNLAGSGATLGDFVFAPIDLTEQQIADLKAGLWYVEITSGAFPEGEIRGQLSETIHYDDFE